MPVSLPPQCCRRFASRYPFLIVPMALMVGVWLAITGAIPVAWAQDAAPSQQPVPQPPRVRFLLPLLQEVSYDPVERGPLLVVAPSTYLPFDVSLPEGRNSLTAIANAMNMRLFPAGQMNVLAERTMTTLNANPGKANPFGGMQPAELLKLLLASFTPAQWGQVGSAGGIGRGNLTEEQSLLWEGIFPARLRVQTSSARPGPTPGSEQFYDTTVTDILTRDAIRLRINRAVTLGFSKQGSEDYSWGGDPYHHGREDGEKRRFLLPVRDGSSDKQRANSAYGAQLISEQPRRLKTGAIDFAAPVLNALVSLKDFPAPPETEKKPIPPGAPPNVVAFHQLQADLAGLPTVGAILERVTQATRIEFIADRRVSKLPVFLRGDSARAGDVLMALAMGVAGAYRSVAPGVPNRVSTNGRADTALLYCLRQRAIPPHG